MIPVMLRRFSLFTLLFGLSGCLTFLTTDDVVDDDDDDAVDDDDVADDDDAVGDSDSDGFTVEQGDCDDDDPTRYPGAEELCDGIDSNCDTVEDTDLDGETRWLDFDNDGFGSANENSTIETCGERPGYVDDNNDCADNDPNIHPEAEEVCNGLDDNCDDRVDFGVLEPLYFDTDLDGHGAGPELGDGCAGLGYSTLNDDCNDNDGTIWEDDDVDFDNDGYDRCAGDCDDSNSGVSPAKEEICNGVDDDCSGAVDDGFVRVGIVHGPSVGTAAGLKTQVDGFGYCAELVSTSTLTGATLFPSDYSGLLVVHNTTTEASGWTAPLDPFWEFHDRCLPTLGMGTGGLALFDQFASSGFPTNITFSSAGAGGTSIVNPVWSQAAIWWTPNSLSSVANNYVQVHTSGTSRTIMENAGNFDAIGTASNVPSNLLLLREFNCGNFWFWGWDVSLASATDDGKSLYENMLWEAIGGP